ncbi:MAG: flagellar basal-body rod protein FlgG, partial [Bdellovibrionota bacterium]
MIKALTTASTGLEAQSANIERIANDLANTNTDGYKRSEIDFQDLMYTTVKPAGAQLGAGSMTPVGIQTGMGVKVGSTHKIFEPGPARMTYHPFDLMIEQKGFFPVQMPATGEIAYTRTGAFKVDGQGRVVTPSGAALMPQITVPANSVGFVVTPSGEVKAIMPNQQESVLGQIQLVLFQNEQGLSAMGDGNYRPTPASGSPLQGIPGENGIGTILQGAREGSNVDVAKSMVDMITTQRAYEMGTKVMGV